MELQEKNITKEKIGNCLNYLQKINWLKSYNQQIYLPDFILELANDSRIESGLSSKYDGVKLSQITNNFRKKGNYKLAEFFGRLVVAYSNLDSNVKATDYATHLNNLALVYDSQGKYPEAQKLYLQALEIDKKTIGENHPNYAIDLNGLGVLYYNWGKKENDRNKLQISKQNIQQALNIFTDKLGKDHPYTQDTQRWLEIVEWELGEG